MKKGWTIWFTGLHGSGKTTIANELVKILRDNKIPVVLLDGDEARKTISSDLRYTIEDRNKHMKRVADFCKIISDNGILSIACVASPTEESRLYAKKTIKKLFTVYIKCPLEVCEKRDVKGHYKKARNKEKEFENFVGISIDFEEPKNPDFIINTDKEIIEDSVNALFNELVAKGILL